jgi:BirA family biotin operon repressor/biotin-[acetyl-CoA-carboxylase] ligase
MVDDLTLTRVRDCLGEAFFDRDILAFDRVGSTNDEARKLAESGCAEGSLVFAEFQSRGRGRLGRRWQAPRGSSLLLSVVLRPRLAPNEVHRLTMASSLAVVDAVERTTGLRLGIKWPNDFVTGHAKIGGVLTEVEFGSGQIDYAVVGIGLNVNLDPEELSGSLLMRASSISHALGYPVARVPLLCEVVRALESRYCDLLAGKDLHRLWARRLVTLGETVCISTAGREFRGVAEGVNENGALLIREASGRLEDVIAGDVTMRGD